MESSLCFKNVVSNDFYEIETSHNNLQIVDTIPGWAHNITIGDDELIVMIWAKEVFIGKPRHCWIFIINAETQSYNNSAEHDQKLFG